jgi:hypothetical protein
MNLDIDVSDDERNRLGRALGATSDLDRIVGIVAKAGAQEALDYATGQAVFSSMADLRSYRIACLLRAGMTIGEAEALVASLFKVPLSTSRRLVSAALARYSVDLEDDIRAATATTLEAATWDKDSGRWFVPLPSGVIRDRIMNLLSQQDLPDPTTAERGALWKIPNDTYQWLREQHGLTRTKPTK